MWKPCACFFAVCFDWCVVSWVVLLECVFFPLQPTGKMCFVRECGEYFFTELCCRVDIDLVGSVDSVLLHVGFRTIESYCWYWCCCETSLERNWKLFCCSFEHTNYLAFVCLSQDARRMMRTLTFLRLRFNFGSNWVDTWGGNSSFMVDSGFGFLPVTNLGTLDS